MRTLRQIGNRQKKTKNSIIFVLLTTLVIIFLFFTGIKILTYTINFFTNLKSSNTSPNSSDTLPPKVPDVYSFNEYTNLQKIVIKGGAEPSSVVYLNLNGKVLNTVADSDGVYIFDLTLKEGNNDFYLYSKDSSGNESGKTKTFTVIEDITEPLLQIDQPSDNSTFTGVKNKLLEIKGITESGVELKVNDKFVNVNDDGTFIYKYDLNIGENTIKLSVKDRAGNETSKELTEIYQE